MTTSVRSRQEPGSPASPAVVLEGHCLVPLLVFLVRVQPDPLPLMRFTLGPPPQTASGWPPARDVLLAPELRHGLAQDVAAYHALLDRLERVAARLGRLRVDALSRAYPKRVGGVEGLLGLAFFSCDCSSSLIMVSRFLRSCISNGCARVHMKYWHWWLRG